jgi:hypothetical protein
MHMVLKLHKSCQQTRPVTGEARRCTEQLSLHRLPAHCGVGGLTASYLPLVVGIPDALGQGSLLEPVASPCKYPPVDRR